MSTWPLCPWCPGCTWTMQHHSHCWEPGSILRSAKLGRSRLQGCPRDPTVLGRDASFSIACWDKRRDRDVLMTGKWWLHRNFKVPRVQGHAYIRRNLAEAGDQGQASRSQSRVGTGAEMENGKLRDCCSKGQNRGNQTILPGEHGSQIHRGLPAAAFRVFRSKVWDTMHPKGFFSFVCFLTAKLSRF